MALYDPLTNEKLKTLFKSDFDLANSLIALAQHWVKAGREVTIQELIYEIRKSPRQYDVAELAKQDQEAEEA